MRLKVWGYGVFVWLVLVSVELRADTLRVQDDQGTPVELERPAQRIVSLAPHVTELLFAAGAGGQVVGVVSYSDYPEPAKALPQVGSYNRFDFERILALKPDLVVGWSSGNGAPQLERLRELGLTLYVTEPRDLEDIATNLERLGALTGHPEGAQAAATFRRERKALEDEFRGRAPISVFYQIWDDPLMTVNQKHLISRVISLCGGSNVFADLKPLAGQVSPEEVMARNPAVIVGGGMDRSRLDWFDRWHALPEIAAVQRDNLFVIHPDLIQRHTPRILQGARQMCQHLDQARAARRP